MKRLVLALALVPAIAGFGFEYVDCIRGDGASRIDTDYKPTKDARVVMEVEFDDYSQLSQPMALFCCRGSDVKKDTFTFLKLYTSPAAHWRFDYAQAAGTQSSASVEHNVRYKIEVSKAGAFVNGEKVGEGGDAEFSPGNNLMLFASYRNGLTANLADYGTFRLYSCQVYDTAGGVEGRLVCNLKPAKDENGAYGLYDVQRTRFLNNAGTGSFLAPKNVSVNSVSALTAALADARLGDVISAAAGTYKLTETLTVPSGVKLVSADGPATTAFEPAEDNPGVMALDITGTLAGFTIRGFKTTSTPVVQMRSPSVLSNCTVTANVRDYKSGGYGIVTFDGNLISHCTFYENSGTSYCMPIASSSGNNHRIEYTLVRDNTCGSQCSGVWMHGGNGWVLDHCTIVGNSSSPQVNSRSRGPTYRNCIFLNGPNYPFCREMPVSEWTCTFVNCLVPNISAQANLKAGSTNNLDLTDARFVFPVGSDYHLMSDSPCIGADEDGGDLGCYPYDPDYVSIHPVVNVKPGDDLVAAVDAATNGTEIRLAPGEHRISRYLNVTNRIQIIGTEGRDKTVIRPSGTGYRLLRQNDYYSRVCGITFLGATNTALKAWNGEVFYTTAGGGGVVMRRGEFFDNRITQCCDTRDGAAIFCVGGLVNRCLIDANAGSTIVEIYGLYPNTSVDGPDGDYSKVASVENTLICNNSNPSGSAVRLQTTTINSLKKQAAEIGLRNCTVIGNDTTFAVSRELTGGLVYDTVVRNVDGTAKAWRDTATNAETATNETSTVWRNCASFVTVGTNCVSGVDLGVKASGKLKWSSPCRKAGFIYHGAQNKTDIDLFGASRVDWSGDEPTIDIGCCQLNGNPPGLMLLVK